MFNYFYFQLYFRLSFFYFQLVILELQLKRKLKFSVSFQANISHFIDMLK